MSFTPKALEFLVENRLRDDRDWFHEHKETYQREVLLPFQQLVVELTPAMLEIDPQFITEPRVDRTISRVYRDTRYTRDKLRYRDRMWLVFQRNKKLYNGLPGFYFQIAPECFTYGCGYYQASPETMDIIRSMILAGDPLFRKAKEAYEGQSLFEMHGPSYKRTRFPGQPEELRLWLDRRSIDFSRSSTDVDLLYSDRLGSTVAEELTLLGPIYRFLMEAEARRLAAETRTEDQ